VPSRKPLLAISFGPRLTASQRFGASARTLVGKPVAWCLLIGALASWPLVWSLRTPLPPEPPILGAVREFELADSGGRRFGSKDLSGRVWIATFVDTRCGAPCTSVTRQVARIQARTRQLEPALHLVTFGAAPARDGPESLAALAREHRASPRMWTFLTGPEADLREVANEALEPRAAGEGRRRGDVMHGTAIVLVDGAARVRGLYDPQVPDVVDRVVRDAARLVNAPAPR
jgi:protein SCO1/2